MPGGNCNYIHSCLIISLSIQMFQEKKKTQLPSGKKQHDSFFRLLNLQYPKPLILGQHKDYLKPGYYLGQVQE